MQAPPSPSQAPPPPLPGIPQIGGHGTDVIHFPVPMTRHEVQALRAQRSELSSQLTSAQRRRNTLAEEMRDAEGADRVGLEQRMVLLDNRILQLEADIAETGRLLSSSGALAGSTTEPGSGMHIGGVMLSNGQVTGLLALMIIFVLAPIAFGFMRLMFKRATRPPAIAESPESRQRFERLEQAVDTIAVEVERVSEGQRYLTRLLTESPVAVPLGAGQRAGEAVSVRKGDGHRSHDEG